MRRYGRRLLWLTPKMTLWLTLSAHPSCAEPDVPTSGHGDEVPQNLRAEGTNNARSGSWTARATLKPSPSYTKLNHWDTAVSKNTTYSASIWARGTGKLQLNVVNGSWTGNHASVTIDATPSWARYAVPNFDSGGDDKVHFSVYDAIGGTAGTVFLDDAFLGPPSGSNLLSNAGFEQGEDTWIPQGAFRIVRASDVAIDGLSPASVAHSGGWAAQAKLGGGPTWTKMNHFESRVEKNSRYIASIWARGGGTLRLDVVNTAGTEEHASVVITTTQSWARYAVPQFTTGADEVVHFRIYDAVGGSAGTVYLDDAFLGLPDGPNLLSNAGFEEGEKDWLPDGAFRIESSTGPVSEPPTPPPSRTPDQSGPDKPATDPSGVTTFAEVSASGTGCPPNSTVTRISRDGLVFTTTFSAYEVRLDPNATLAVKECRLSIKLHTPEGRSFSVQTFYYSGYALLKKGATGRQLASYAFAGQDQQSRSARTDLVGPYEMPFVFTDQISLQDAVWSPCGVARELTISSRIVLESTTPGSVGYMNLTAADGSSQLVLRLASRPCTPSRSP